MEEAKAPQNTKAMNAYLLTKSGNTRTLEAIKGARKKQEYKELVLAYREQLAGESTGNPSSRNAREIDPSANSLTPVSISKQQVQGDSPVTQDWLRRKCEDIIPEMNGGIWIRAAIRRALEGQPVDQCLDDWWKNTFPDLCLTNLKQRNRRYIHKPLSKRKTRRKEYKRMQLLWRSNLSKAARKVLDGDADNMPHPALCDQVNYWRPIFENESRGIAQDTEWNQTDRTDTALNIWTPITEAEVITTRLPLTSAPGLDGMTVKRWMSEVPAIIRASIFNIFVATGKMPKRFSSSRTILIPKDGDLMLPANYRPVSVASVILRHFHKILANRLTSCKLFDKRQRGFIAADGCAENIAILSSILLDAHDKRNPIHIITLDVRKAFDTVSHKGIYGALARHAIPKSMIEYLQSLYSTASLRLQVDKNLSEEICPTQGVRQGDPLSPLIFNLVMNEVLAAVPDQVGYNLMDSNVNALAFADDLILIGSTIEGTQLSLNKVNDALGIYGLQMAPTKCAAFSLLPSGKIKKMRIMTESCFVIADQPVRQVGILETIKYLGIRFNNNGPQYSFKEIGDLLSKIRIAPLKPQQRMKILRSFLLPRFIHGLVLGRTTHAALRKLDRQIRMEVRKWLALPQDVPTAFFHSPIRQGGLGIMSFESAIPGLVMARLERLMSSDFELARRAGSSLWAEGKKRWCRASKRKNEDWPSLLYHMVDGYELREAVRVPASTDWLDDSMVFIPPSDWLHYIKIWINALPTRIRTTRGNRRQRENVGCRGGCPADETAAHVIQQCFRSHGGRIMRHDAIASVVASELQRGGYEVKRELLFRTGVGARKPDILAAKGDRGYILDVQVVSGGRPLLDAHKRKKEYYEGNRELLGSVSELLQVPPLNLETSTITLSWRGIWAEVSANKLTALGISRLVLKGITTRVLKGSWLNFARFNQTTMRFTGRAYTRMSGWGPPQSQ